MHHSFRNPIRAFASIATLSLATASVMAASIVGTGQPVNEPALTGGNVITFDTPGAFTGNSLTIDDVTITSDGPDFDVTTTWSGQYNTTGLYLETTGAVATFTFSFAQPVNAFAFNFGASDVVWNITAYDGSQVVDTYPIQTVGASNNQEYFGLSSPRITKVELTNQEIPNQDYVLLDNFTYAFAPVPNISLVCAPSTLVDAADQVSTCTVTSDVQAGSAGISVNLTPPASSPRFTTSCASALTIPAGGTTATCTITATANTVVGDGDVVANLAIAAPTAPGDYAVIGSPAQVTITDNDVAPPQPAAPTPVPALGGVGLLLLSGVVAGSMGLMRRRKSN